MTRISSGRAEPALEPLQPGEQVLLPAGGASKSRGGGQQHLGTDELKLQPRRRRPAHVHEPGADRLRGPGQLRLPELASLLAHPVQPVGRHVEEPGLGGVGHGGQHDQVTKPVEEIRGEPPGIVPGLDHPVHSAEHRRPVAPRECLSNLVQQAVVGIAQQRHGSLVGQPGIARAREQLIKHRESVTRRARARPDHNGQDSRLVTHVLVAEYLLEQPAQDGGRHQPERIVMGA